MPSFRRQDKSNCMENWAEIKLRFQTEFRSRGLPNRCLQFRTEYFAFPKENFIAGPTTGKDEKRPLNHNRMAVKWVPPLAFIFPYAVFIDKHKNEGGLFLPIERQSCQSHKHDLLLLKRGPKDCRAVSCQDCEMRTENWDWDWEWCHTNGLSQKKETWVHYASR